jgi:hypothetical protein
MAGMTPAHAQGARGQHPRAKYDFHLFKKREGVNQIRAGPTDFLIRVVTVHSPSLQLYKMYEDILEILEEDNSFHPPSVSHHLSADVRDSLGD